jgi:tRNA A-37 threonylcarbamoyl transferase component Bud32
MVRDCKTDIYKVLIMVEIKTVLQGISISLSKLYLLIKRKYRDNLRSQYYLNFLSNYICHPCVEESISSVSDLVMREEDKQALFEKIYKQGQVVIGNFDSDGYLLSQVGWIGNIPTCQIENYKERSRFQIKLIAVNTTLAVEKNYKNNKSAFINEAIALIQLNKASCNVPRLISIDCNRLTLVFSFILGDVLRQILAKNGAIAEERQLTPTLKQLSRKKRNEFRIHGSQAILKQIVPSSFINNLLYQVELAHKRNIILNDIHYGNIIINHKSGELFLIDFDWTSYCPEIPDNFFTYLTRIDLQKIHVAFASLIS